MWQGERFFRAAGDDALRSQRSDWVLCAWTIALDETMVLYQTRSEVALHGLGKTGWGRGLRLVTIALALVQEGNLLDREGRLWVQAVLTDGAWIRLPDGGTVFVSW